MLPRDNRSLLESATAARRRLYAGRGELQTAEIRVGMISMGRIQIQLPKTFTFSTDIGVRISDINYGNHLGNDAVLRLINEARVRFLRQYGFSEFDIGGFGLILTDAVIVYKSQGFYGDQLKIEVAAAEPSRHGCDLYYRLTNKATGKEVARAKTGLVLFDYAVNKMALLPEDFKRIIPPENS